MKPTTVRTCSLHLMLLVATATLGAGCAPDLPPEVPTYEVDIKPIVLSRCVRCHGGGGTLNADPDITSTVNIGAPRAGYFDHFEDQGTCTDADGTGSATCKRGLGYYATTVPTILRTYIDATDEKRMPPPPAPTLTHHQLEVFHNWLAESPPMP